MIYKHRANGFIYATKQEMISGENERLGLLGKVYNPLTNGNTPVLIENPVTPQEDATEEERAVIARNNIAFIAIEYKPYNE